MPLILRLLSTWCNGDFERGDFTCWRQEEGELPSRVIPQDGNHVALLGDPDLGSGADGNIPVGSARVSQDASLPDAGDVSLVFQYRLISYDSDATDGLTLEVTAVSGEQKCHPDWEAKSQQEQAGSKYDSGWQETRISLASCKGQRVKVQFRNANRADGFWNTWTYLDNVRMAQ